MSALRTEASVFYIKWDDIQQFVLAGCAGNGFRDNIVAGSVPDNVYHSKDGGVTWKNVSDGFFGGSIGAVSDLGGDDRYTADVFAATAVTRIVDDVFCKLKSLLPGILLITIANGIGYVSYRLFLDKQRGIFERFHSMPIARSAALWGHVLTSLVSNAISVVVIILVAVIMGFRSPAGGINLCAAPAART